MLRFENQHWEHGRERVAGVDEAGRGPLAGPVVAAAVVLDPDFAREQETLLLSGLTDSKKLSPVRREHFYNLLIESEAVDTGVGIASVEEIDELNILHATYAAMARAVASLSRGPDYVLVDGRPVDGLPCESAAIVGGDGRSLSIAAASIVAKVARDGIMSELDKLYPEYGFAGNKGYGSRAHIRALLEVGPCPVHRRSFRPVRELTDIRNRAEGLEGLAQGDLFDPR